MCVYKCLDPTKMLEMLKGLGSFNIYLLTKIFSVFFRTRLLARSLVVPRFDDFFLLSVFLEATVLLLRTFLRTVLFSTT